jgi:hypothetical protein
LLLTVHDCAVEPAVRTSLMKDPESMEFIPAAMSPTGYDTLIAGGAASNTLTTFKVATGMPEDYYMCTATEDVCPTGCKKIQHVVHDLTVNTQRRLLFASFLKKPKPAKPVTEPVTELHCPADCVANMSM